MLLPGECVRINKPLDNASAGPLGVSACLQGSFNDICGDAYLTENSQTASSSLTAGVSTIMDKNTEVLVCGASIMKDVWEIKLREYRQKQQLEEERIRKSALERINQDWQTRMSFKIKTPKRLERKAKLPEELTLDAHKAKKTHLGMPQGFQSSRIQRQVDSTKTTKANKLPLLRHLNESCPGLMVWAKS